MMGRLNHDQEQFFYSFRLDEAVPNDHPLREIAAVLDLSWVHSELAPYYSRLPQLCRETDREAGFAIDYAIASIEQANLAVLDAVDGRLAVEEAKRA
jgi:hypothetical protein